MKVKDKEMLLMFPSCWLAYGWTLYISIWGLAGKRKRRREAIFVAVTAQPILTWMTFIAREHKFFWRFPLVPEIGIGGGGGNLWVKYVILLQKIYLFSTKFLLSFKIYFVCFIPCFYHWCIHYQKGLSKGNADDASICDQKHKIKNNARAKPLTARLKEEQPT